MGLLCITLYLNNIMYAVRCLMDARPMNDEYSHHVTRKRGNLLIK